MRKLLLYLILFCCAFSESYAYLVPGLPNNNSVSASFRAPQGNTRWIRTCYIISAAELAASNFPSGVTISGIGWLYSVAQSIPTNGTLKVYLQNTSDLAYSKPSTAWTNGTDGVIDNMTLVSDAATTIPSIVGNYDVVFANGSTFTYTGGGLYVAYEYSNTTNPLSTAPTVLCSNVLVGGSNGLRNVSSTSTTTAPATLTGTSNFRPDTRLGYPVANDVTMHDIYSEGQLALGYSTPHTISARIVNTCDNPITNVPVTLGITGANTFNDVQNVTIPVGGSTVVSFSTFTPTVAGTNTISISVPTDDNNTNNAKTFVQNVNTGTRISYANDELPTSSIGFNTGTGILANKHYINGGTNVLSVTIFLSPTATNTGNTITGMMLDATGTIVGQSAPHVITASELGTYVTLDFLAAPLATNQEFYIGILQGANAVTGYFPVGVQPEPLPARSGAYYSFGATGGAATQYTNLGRFVITANISQFPLAAKDLVLHATLVKQDVKLDWKGVTHDKVLKYEVERSTDGVGFVTTGTVPGVEGNENTYYFTDANAANCSLKMLYYRIKQTDVGGNISYSPVAKVTLDKQNSFDVSVVNPARGAIQLSVNMPEAGDAGILITDVQGRTVYSSSRQLAAGAHTFSLNDAAQLAPGSYFISVIQGSNKLTQKFQQL